MTLLVDAPSVETTTVSLYADIDAGPGIPLANAVVGGNTYIFSTAVEAIYLPVILKDW